VELAMSGREARALFLGTDQFELRLYFDYDLVHELNLLVRISYIGNYGLLLFGEYIYVLFQCSHRNISVVSRT
jgi:hypothetical protein